MRTAVSTPLTREEVFRRLSRSPSLPTLPGAAVRLVEIGQDPEVDLGAVAAAVRVDPALVAKLLRVANSPIYARQRRTHNLRQAILLLGLNGTLTLALSFSLAGALKGAGRHGMDHDLFWRRSLAVGAACRALGTRLGLASAEDLFLVGLLQDIGMLALDRVTPEIYRGLGRAQIDHRVVCERERAGLGLDHAEVGAWLLRTWNLPTQLIDTVAGSHDPATVESEAEDRPLVRCAVLAGVLGDIWVREDPEAASADAVVAANALGLGGATIAGVLEAISLDLQALAPVFEVSLREPEAMELLLEQAKETALLRSIQMIGDSSRLSGAAESLEERARVLEEQARRDGLTGLYNRRYLDERLAEELSNARTHGWPLAIAFIDLDLFKRVNDTYGHQAGDEVLRGAARLLLAGTRSSDVVARFGGEEFLILLPGTGLASALVVTERLVASFRESRHAVAGHQEVRVTISVGLAVQGEGQDFESPEELVRAADRAVYAAKRLGRDRWVVYGSDKAV